MHALTRRWIESVPNAPLHPDHRLGELRDYARVHIATASSSAGIAGLGELMWLTGPEPRARVGEESASLLSCGELLPDRRHSDDEPRHVRHGLGVRRMAVR